MYRVEASKIAAHFKDLGSLPGARYKLKQHQRGKVLKNWSRRLDGIQSEGGFLFEDEAKERLWVLLVDWGKGNFYVILYNESKTKLLAEIHKWHDLDAEPRLTWRYQPSKHDGRNKERVAYFVEAFFSRDVHLSVPTSVEDASDFLDELFALADCRQKANDLDHARPVQRDSFPEGKMTQKLHFLRERNQSLIRLAKQNGMDSDGRVRCACCDLDFSEMYGPEGKGFIEAHHTKPVSTLHVDGDSTHVDDIALVCANCHRMLHRKRPWLEMHELSTLLVQQKSTPTANR